jgi:hypothetical protein
MSASEIHPAALPAKMTGFLPEKPLARYSYNLGCELK